MYRMILVACDATEACGAVVEQAARLAALCRAGLHLVGVVPTGGSLAVAEALGPDDVWGREERETRLRLDGIVADLRQRGLTAASSVRLGDPAGEIAACAREQSADLIVAGRAARSAFARLWHESVSGRLVDRAPCAVLVVAEEG